MAREGGEMVKRNPRGASMPKPACKGAAEPTQEDIRQGGGRAGDMKEPEVSPTPRM